MNTGDIMVLAGLVCVVIGFVFVFIGCIAAERNHAFLDGWLFGVPGFALVLIAVALFILGPIVATSTYRANKEHLFITQRQGIMISSDSTNKATAERFTWIDSDGRYRQSLLFTDPWTNQEVTLDVLPGSPEQYRVVKE